MPKGENETEEEELDARDRGCCASGCEPTRCAPPRPREAEIGTAGGTLSVDEDGSSGEDCEAAGGKGDHDDDEDDEAT